MTTYASSDDFAYMHFKTRPPSIWQRLQWWFADLIGRLLSDPDADWLTNLIFYLILFLVLAAAIFYILKLQYGGAFSGDARFKSAAINVSPSTEKVNYDQLIDDAVQEENFKLAIRYVYLKALVFLSGRELIQLRDWKAPRDYEGELSAAIAPTYNELTSLFEFVWYGEFGATEQDFRRSESLVGDIEKHSE